jgi:hypothetical protein
VAPAVRSRELYGLAKSDGCEYPFEHGNKRWVGVVLVHAGPGKQRAFAVVDDGQAQDEVRLDSAAAVPVMFVGGAFGAADRTGEEASGLLVVTFISVAGWPSTVILVTLENSAPSLVWLCRYCR